MKKIKNIAVKKYFDSVKNDTETSIIWCFIAIQRIMGLILIKHPEIVKEFQEDIIINHIIPYINEFTKIMNKEIKEMKVNE